MNNELHNQAGKVNAAFENSESSNHKSPEVPDKVNLVKLSSYRVPFFLFFMKKTVNDFNQLN